VIAPYFPPQAAIIPTLPGLLQGGTLTITLGRATASSAASPPFNMSFTPPAFPSTPVSSVTAPATPGVPATTGVAPSTTPAGTSAVPASTPSLAAPATSNTPATRPAPVSIASNPISLSSPLAAGLVVLGLLAAAAVGYGLWGLARSLVPEDPGVVCPLGRENP
jgi:Tfp pilus assembly protein FimV